MKEHADREMSSNPFEKRAQAYTCLFCALAWLFSYPSQEEATEFSNPAFFDSCWNLATLLGITDDALAQVQQDILDRPESLQAASADLRAEHTRLFISYPKKLSLEGSHWKGHRTQTALLTGERHAVDLEYRTLGLKRKENSKEPVDHVVSELDFLAYLCDAEAQAWHGNDTASAQEWMTTRKRFIAVHLRDMATGLADGIDELSSNAVVRFSGALLRVTVCSAETNYH